MIFQGTPPTKAVIGRESRSFSSNVRLKLSAGVHSLHMNILQTASFDTREVFTFVTSLRPLVFE
jgi:hypothetical protein